MCEYIEKGPGRFYPQKCDVSSEEELTRIFDWVKKTFGTVHILINNAGAFKSGAIDGIFNCLLIINIFDTQGNF